MSSNQRSVSWVRISGTISLALLLVLAYVPYVLAEDDDYEENDTKGTAAEVDYGYYDRLTVSDTDDDWYKIELDDGDDIVVTVTFDGDEADIELELYNETGDDPIDGSYGVDDDEQVVALDVEAGWYYIYVFSYDDEAEYDMNVTDDFEVPEGIINIAQAVFDFDFDSLLNDCTFKAHIEGDGVPDVNLTIYDNLDNEVASGTTNGNGEWTNSNMSNGDYHWDAEYQGEMLEDEGTFDVAVGIREVQAYGVLADDDSDDKYNDEAFWAYDNQWSGVEDVEVEIRWESNDTYYANGTTDEDGEYIEYDLPEDNFTFTITYNAEEFNTGWVHSFGGGTGPVEDDQYEENDDKNESAEVDYGNYTDLYCQDDDWYKIYLDDGDDINVTINFDGDEADLDLELYDEDDNLIDGSYGTGDNESVEAADVDEGWYYIKVFRFEGRTNYTMSITDDFKGPEGIINIAQGIDDHDNDTLLNDCNFQAHIKWEDISGVNITIYDSLDNEIAGGSTDANGEWTHSNMSNGDYYWIAEYDGELMDDEGTFDVAVGVRDVQHHAYITDWDWDGNHNDKIFTAYDQDGDGVEGVDIEIHWASNDTYYSDGVTDGNGRYTEYDIPEDNFTFTATYTTEEFNTGWFHSYGGGGGGDDTDEWFESWDYETKDTGDDNRDDTIEIGYNPDTEADEMDIFVSIDIYRDDDHYDGIWEWYTIYGEEWDWFTVNWTADRDGSYDFKVYLYDDEFHQEDYFSIENVTLYAEPLEGIINLAQRVADADNGTIMNDCQFWAHIRGDSVAGVNLSIYDSLDNLIANGTTDEHGEWEHFNLTNGDYYWTAEYDDEELEDNGTFDVNMGVREVQATSMVTAWHHDGYHNDVWFYAYDDNEDGVENADIEIHWAANDTFYSDGQTDEDGEYIEEDLPEDNFTFTITYNSDTFNTGWFHSYGGGGGSNESDEWFADWDHETYDSGSDGDDDSIRIMYDPDTEADEMDITVEVTVYYDDDWYDSISENHMIRGESEDWFNQEWTTDRTGSFDFNVSLYDENGTFEDGFDIEDVYLEEEDGGGNRKPDAFIDDIDPSPADEAEDIDFEGHGVDSDGTIEAHNWRSDLDGDLSTLEDFSTDYLSVGIHTIYYKVQDDDGAWSDEVSQTLEVENVKPTASIDDIDPEPADEGEDVDFEGSGEDARGTIDGYEWRSDIDGALSTEASFTTDQLSVGTHTISFTVKDDEGEWSEPVTVSVEIENVEPTATIDDIDPSPAAQGSTVSFEGSGSDPLGSITDYQWRSNRDGQLSTEATFETSALAVGTHTIYFKVKDDEGEWSDEVSERLTIESTTPVASIDSVSPNPAREGDTIIFEGSGTDPDGTIIAYKWELDGVEVSTQATFSRSDLTEGTYLVELLVQDDDGTWSTPDAETLEVEAGNQAPTATIDDIDPNPAEENEEVAFEGSGSDPDGWIVGYEWQIDGTIFSTKAHFTKDDLEPGTYTVSFRVQDNDEGWSEAVTETLEVEEGSGGGGDDDDPAPGFLVALLMVGLVAVFLERRKR